MTIKLKPKGIINSLGTEALKEVIGHANPTIDPPTTRETHPRFVFNYGYDYKLVLSNFPGNYDIGLLSNVQAVGSARLGRVIKLAEKILKAAGMSAMAFTVNSGFDHEAAALDMGFTREVMEGNPHSGNTIRFFIKEL